MSPPDPNEKPRALQGTGQLSEIRNDNATISKTLDVSSLFAGLIRDMPLRLSVRCASGKRLLPIDICEDPAALLRGHFSGDLPPVAIRCADGRTWTESAGEALAVCCMDGDGKSPFVAWDFDCAGGHACTTAEDTAQGAALLCYELIAATGLTALLVASGGGRGRHVWCIFPVSVTADFGVFLVKTVADEVLKKFPGATIDLRPATNRPPGPAIILPAAGRRRVSGGGQVIFLHHAEHRPAMIALDRLSVRYDIIRARALAEEQARRADRVRRLAAKSRRAGSIESRDISLAAVAEVAGDFVRNHGNEVHVRCANCSGTTKINSAKRSWACFACAVGGTGDAASYLLAKWLTQSTDSAHIFSVLREAQESANV